MYLQVEYEYKHEQVSDEKSHRSNKRGGSVSNKAIPALSVSKPQIPPGLSRTGDSILSLRLGKEEPCRRRLDSRFGDAYKILVLPGQQRYSYNDSLDEEGEEGTIRCCLCRYIEI
jgi:hypothetical protein